MEFICCVEEDIYKHSLVVCCDQEEPVEDSETHQLEIMDTAGYNSVTVNICQLASSVKNNKEVVQIPAQPRAIII